MDMHDHATVPRVAWGKRECQCVHKHSPVPLEVELHHTFPQWAQIRVFGKVQDNETVALCPTGHVSVHQYINCVLHNTAPPKINKYLKEVAESGLTAIRVNHVPGPYPSPVIKQE